MVSKYRYQILLSGDSLLIGNWYSFPPPDEGFYDFRKVEGTPASGLRFQYFERRRVYQAKNRLLSMGVRVSKMSPGDGWQFRFAPKGASNWRPMVVVYDLRDPHNPVIVERRDVSGQLPLARSIEEARYIVRQIPERWPIFHKIHIEFTEERLQS